MQVLEAYWRLRWGVASCPLAKPYDLSFAKLTEYHSVWVAAEDSEGRIGIGEAVPLPGYNWETLETIHTTVARLVELADGKATTEIVRCCTSVAIEHPFAASAVMTAIDMPDHIAVAGSESRFPLSAPVAGDTEPDELRAAVETAFAGGYRFLKCKVGRNPQRDAEAARLLLREWPGQTFGVVFDANQAYSTDAALAFAEVLADHAKGGRLQWFEQPVHRGDWRGMERLCRESRSPVVLDEGIYSQADVERAAAIGAHGIKLKLFKNFGIAETLRLARRARELGLVVVFGNGVATDLGNLGEYLALAAADGLFEAPGECSGFAKLSRPLLGSLLRVEEGSLACNNVPSIGERIREFVARVS